MGYHLFAWQDEPQGGIADYLGIYDDMVAAWFALPSPDCEAQLLRLRYDELQLYATYVHMPTETGVTHGWLWPPTEDYPEGVFTVMHEG